MKSYTDLEQSKKLAEILPIESADIHYNVVGDAIIGDYQSGISSARSVAKAFKKNPDEFAKKVIPCWSLAALLEQLEDEITDEDGNDYNLTIIKGGVQYQLYYHDEWYQAEDIETDWHDDMIDACVEMIVKLKEKGLM